MKRVLSFLLCVLMLAALCVPTFAADAPTIDTSRKASLTIYKYDMTTAAEHGLTDSVYVSTGQSDGTAAAAFAPYAIPGVEFMILRVGNIDTYATGTATNQTIQVVYGITNKDLIAALGLTNADVVHTKDGVNYYSSDRIIKALSDKLTSNNTSTKDKLEAIIAKDAGSKALPLTDNTGKTSVSNLEVGLYLVVETKVPENVTYTVDPFLVSLPTTDRETLDHWFYDVTVYPKNQTGEPSLEKEVADADHGLSFTDAKEGYEDVATISDNELVNYRILSTLPQIHSTATYLTQYDFVDTLSKGIEYNKNDVKICWYKDAATAAKDYTASSASAGAVNGTKADAVWGSGSEFFNVSYGTAADDATTMTVKLTKAGLAEVNKPASSSAQQGKYSGWTMVIYYNATVDADNLVTYGDKGNPNKVVLTWSRTTDGFRNTKEDEAKVYAYGIDLTKVLSEGGTDFKAVQFTLQNKSNQTGTFYLEAEKAEDGIYYITGNTTKESDATKFSPDDKGKLLIYGLEEDSYVLTEVQTASGYTLLKDSIEIVVKTAYTPGDKCGALTASASVDGDTVKMEAVGDSSNALVPLTVLNTRGFDLPKTGGAGTLATTVCGIFVLAGVIAVAVVAKRKHEA